jgi:hypothetical protein
LKWSFDSLRAYCTTDKRPASHLESRPYRTGYNALDDCRYRRLVLLVLLLPSLDPLSGQAFRSGFTLYSTVKVLKKICFQLYHPTISHKVKFQDIAIISVISPGGGKLKQEK